MIDLTSKLLPVLDAHKLPGVEFGEDAVHPKYDGQSILNIPGSLCRLWDIPQFGEMPLTDEILEPLGNGVRKIVLILMDAMALHRLQNWMANGDMPAWNELGKSGLLAPITSITPSTTSAALTSYWTGRSAAAHGIVGYEQWLKEYGMVTNMILHTPIAYNGDVGGLQRAGFDPDTFLPVPTIGPHLLENGITPHAFMPRGITNSGLSQMHLKSANLHGISTPSELWINVRDLLESQADERLYTWVYWPQFDNFSHHYGPDDVHPKADFETFSAAFQRYFLDALSPQARKDTVVILTADHGQIFTPLDPHYELKSHPELDRMLHFVTGENRLMYLFIRPGRMQDVHDYFDSTWQGEFDLIDPRAAVDAGLFGPGPVHPRLHERLGDLIAFPRNHSYIWWANKENFMLGRHGGIHREEMLVPFLASRL